MSSKKDLAGSLWKTITTLTILTLYALCLYLMFPILFLLVPLLPLASSFCSPLIIFSFLYPHFKMPRIIFFKSSESLYLFWYFMQVTAVLKAKIFYTKCFLSNVGKRQSWILPKIASLWLCSCLPSLQHILRFLTDL